MIYTIISVLVGALCVTRVETLARTNETFLGAMWEGLPFIMLAQFCIYQVFSRGSSIMMAWLGWTLTVSVIRIINSHCVLNEGLDLKWVAMSVMLMTSAAVCMKQA
tara:strand:+ start:447 stop:764 length:318 start_codon:yes stop_codon:yes gene_type:complete